MTGASELLREFAIVVPCAAMLSAALIVVLLPVLVRHALAQPNARSSHTVPTPQGGGIAVIAATLIVTAPAALLSPAFAAGEPFSLWVLLAAVALLAAVGVVDDLRTLSELPRLALQFLAVLAVVAALPNELRVAPALPLPLERGLAVIAGVWMVNLTNFMDGIDWMTVAEVVPVTAGGALLVLIGAAPATALIVALALLGALLGFAPFNRPVAKLFLGDVGSLPIGLIVFWLLMQVAGSGHLAAALLLPLYYLADATLTLLMRLRRGENIMQAHRGHFYQRAVQRGLPVPAVIARVAATNAALALLALASAWASSPAVSIAALALGAIAVAALLHSLAGRTA